MGAELAIAGWAGAIGQSGAGFWPLSAGRAVEPTGDASLARAASRGDREAFTRLVEAHKRSVYGLAVRLLRDPEDARDAAQEAFVRAFQAIGTFDAAQPFAPWILRIARNHCLDVLRRRPAVRPVSLEAPVGDDEDAPVRDVADENAERGDDRLERAETASALRRAVGALPDNYREVIVLYHVEHLAYADIARVLNVPMGTVMTWLHRARARLRESLAGVDGVKP